MSLKKNKINDMIEKLIDDNIDRSFVVCDLDDIVKKYESWTLAMPKIKPFYAVKSNNYQRVLQLLFNLGTGFECATKYEIEAVLKTNCPPQNIIFANPMKEINHVHYANSVGVSLTTFDSLTELEKCKEHYPKAKLVIRIKTYSKNPTNFETKFGADPYSDAPILLAAAKSLELNVVGVSFHVGTICDNGSIYCTAIKLARYVFDVGHQLGFNFNLLDIGGGFVAFADTAILEIGKCINTALDTYFPGDSVKFIAEPGRYFVRSSMTLATRVICAKPNRTESNPKEVKYVYHVDNGVFRMFQAIVHGFVPPSPVAWKKAATSVYPSIIFGQTMVDTDLISVDVKLPKLNVGDWVIYENMGAYTQCLESEFCLYKPTPVYFITRCETKYNIRDVYENPFIEMREEGFGSDIFC